eukprot:1326565-Rhodomonas_salina.1
MMVIALLVAMMQRIFCDHTPAHLYLDRCTGRLDAREQRNKQRTKKKQDDENKKENTTSSTNTLKLGNTSKALFCAGLCYVEVPRRHKLQLELARNRTRHSQSHPPGCPETLVRTAGRV